MNYVFLILGLATLIVGGEFLVRGAVGIAKKFQISTLVIGMTVISFGTSAPELLVSLSAAIDGHPEISMGNVVGSNIANISLVLGLTVMIFPIVVDRNSKVIDWPVMMLATILYMVFAWDLEIVWWEGAILFAILIIFTFLLIRNSRKVSKKKQEEVEDDDEIAKVKDKIGLSVVFLAAGLVALYFGANWLLDGAVGIALDLGMEERVIAVTIVAFGTSVPELVTSAVAAFKKETDISVGNLIGSNIFNIMAVIGLTSMIHPVAVSEPMLYSDMMWMSGIALALLPILILGAKLNRFKGALLFSTYAVYIAVLVIMLP